MSATFKVEVVQIGKLDKHPNADTLSTTEVFGFPAIVRTGEFKEGDKAVYVPVDAIVPTEDPRFAFLGDNKRIKAKRLRGIFSMGLLIPAEPDMQIGEDVKDRLKITKWEPPQEHIVFIGGDCIPDPGMPKYTDIENFRRYNDVIKEGEEVVVTEKLHGTNFRAGYINGEFYVGSHNTVKKESPDSLYWKAAIKENLKELLLPYPNLILFGEVYGWVQDLRYGMKQGEFDVSFFDALNIGSMRYMDFHDFAGLISRLNLQIVPIVHLGPFSKDILKLAEDKSFIADQIREGLVIKPVTERFDFSLGGRTILKYLSENYLTRKGGTEFH